MMISTTQRALAVLVLAAVPALAASPSKPVASAASSPDRAEALYHFALGQQARLAGETENALAEYRKAQRLDPRSGEIRAEIARLLREAGRLDEALPEAAEAVRLDPGCSPCHVGLAQIHQMRFASSGDEGELKAAATEYEEVAKLEPSDATAALALAALYGQLQQHGPAVAAWRRYLSLDPGSFEAYLQLGSHELAQSHSKEAAEAFQKALTLQPGSARAYQSLADVYAGAEQADQAIVQYRKALEIEPENVRVRLSLGEVLFRARRYKEALAEADRVLAGDARNRYAFDLQGRSWRDLKEFDKAAEVTERALAADPSDLKAAYLKVTIAEARRDFAAAARLLETVLARDHKGEDDGAKNDRVFLIHLGFAYQQTGRAADAGKAFGQAIAVGGDPDAALLGYRIEALVQAKDLDHALVEVRAARAKFPDESDLTGLEATVLRERGQTAAAIDIIEGLRKKSPKDIGVLLQVSEFYQRAKRLTEAEAVLLEARKVEPKNLRVLFQLGAAIERQKRPDDAESVFREALQVQPDAAPVLNYLGYMNAERGVRVDEALGLIEKAVGLDPGNGAYMDSLGWALFRLNRLEQAEENLRKAVAKQEKNAVILDHLGDTLKRRGALREALQCWQRALEGEDEGEELDRKLVQRKIHDAQLTLEAQKNE